MKNFDLKDYVKVYDNFLDQNFCNSITDSLDTLSYEKHSFYNAQTDNTVSNDTDFQITYDNFLKKNILQEKLWFAIERYILKDHNFSWWQSWTGYSSVRFNKYDKNTEMNEHCDHIHSLFDNKQGLPVLSIIGLLNENFKGGEFIMWGDQQIHIGAGSLVVFPSNFLYPHLVKPVQQGTRYSFVSWVY